MADKNIADAEVVEQEIETVEPGATGVLKEIAPGTIDDQLILAENIDKLIAAQNKIRLALLGLAQPGDWTVFEGKTGKKAEIGFAGCARIGSTLGVTWKDFEATKLAGTDEGGNWYRWEFECTTEFRGRAIRVYGRAGSRDVFFGKADGEFKELHELNEGNIKMAARRSAMKEGVKTLFGLHHMDPEYLTKNKVPLGSAGGYKFGDKTTAGAAAATEAATVALSAAKLAKEGTSAKGPWSLYEITDAEGVKYISFRKEVYDKAQEALKNGVMVTISSVKSAKGELQVTAITLSDKRVP